MNYALNADFFHTRARLGLDSTGTDAPAARAFARQAGRACAIAGQFFASIHVSQFPVLLCQFAMGYNEVLLAKIGGASADLLDVSLATRSRFDAAVHKQDSVWLLDVMYSICEIAADNGTDSVPFFSDLPELTMLIDAAVERHEDTDALAEAAAAHERWKAALPTAAQLMSDVKRKASADGQKYEFEGYTLWCEPAHGGWSLTNAYGVDYCAFLSSEASFQWLLDAVVNDEDVGAVPPGCEKIADDADDHPDIVMFYACEDAAIRVMQRLGFPNPNEQDSLDANYE
ncbi:hypothetical protein PAQ31011_05176 [Pandoraea aquatica]|uniref:Uncharacterized protein n=1 Tax=Pandoraea aquatica TaxID=2508290 RepID=A0A5E4Z8Q0_9BURK|nr:hypothetical protein [Pandoraea aquatica]VVE57052.1 hypothetical protein PAQ31011_05176 [Pandoraea aquatica]